MKGRPPFRRARAALAVMALLVFASLLGCEVIFTTSLLSFLQRDPASLPPAQQVAWAEQALASGDPAAMAAAYDLVKDDPANALLAARLALELSGVPGVLSQMIQDLDSVLDLDEAGMESYFDGLAAGVDAARAGAAGGHFAVALAADPNSLSGQDMILGALSLAFAEADAGSGFVSLVDGGPTDSFVATCLLVLPSDDPAFEVPEQLALMTPP